MGLIRKIISGLVFLVGVVALVALCMNDTAMAMYESFMGLFEEIDVMNIMNWVTTFVVYISVPLLLTMTGLIGLTIPSANKD